MAMNIGHKIIEKNGVLADIRIRLSDKPHQKGVVLVNVTVDILAIYDDWGIGAT